MTEEHEPIPIAESNSSSNFDLDTLKELEDIQENPIYVNDIEPTKEEKAAKSKYNLNVRLKNKNKKTVALTPEEQELLKAYNRKISKKTYKKLSKESEWRAKRKEWNDRSIKKKSKKKI